MHAPCNAEQGMDASMAGMDHAWVPCSPVNASSIAAHSTGGMLGMDDAMPWDWQRAHALRAMATLRGRSSATRHTAHLAARPDRARAHVQRGTAVRTVLQVAEHGV